MNTKKTLSFLLAAVMLMSITAMAAPLKDMLGREINLQEPAQRIVALTASDVEILYALGAGDRLVGRGEYCNYPLEALEVPSVQSGMETNIEQIIALEPDLVIAAKMAQSPEQAEALEKAGIAVVVTEAASLSEIFTSFALLGALTGKEEEAAALTKDIQTRLDAISAKAAEHDPQTIYFEVSPLEYGLWTAGAGTFMQEIADILNLKSIFYDVDGWAEVSQEQIFERDPDYIVTIAMYFGDGPTPVEEIKSRIGWDSLKTVKEDQIIQMDTDQLSRPGPRLADAAELLYDIVYGEDAQIIPAA